MSWPMNFGVVLSHVFDGGREGCPRKEIRMRKVVVVEWMKNRIAAGQAFWVSADDWGGVS
jgi:hypothetical protein